VLEWSLVCDGGQLAGGEIECPSIALGKNIHLAQVSLDFSLVSETSHCTFAVRMGTITNEWPIHIFCTPSPPAREVFHTKDWPLAKAALREGRTVLYTPRMDELDYDSPPASFLNVFWNGQMGPNWRRQMGMVICNDHPIFRHFATASHGGWQWEEILERARGFNMEGMGCEPIVRLIDDHNRSFDLSLIFGCRMLAGNLLVVSADLEGSFEERPAAYTLKQAVTEYLASGLFTPEVEADPLLIERRLHPNQVMRHLQARVTTLCHNPEAVVDGNPNTSAIIEGDCYPLSMEIAFRETEAEGVIMLHGQRDRMHEGNLQTICLEGMHDGRLVLLGTYTLSPTIREQRLAFAKTRLSALRLTVLSGFRGETETGWEERHDGWYQVSGRPKAVAEIAALNLIIPDPPQGRDECYWLERVPPASRDLEA
jgi:hypothetical protein